MTNTTITWAAEAACIGKTEMFFQDTLKTIVDKAKRICNTCEAKDQCLDYAVKNFEHGVWGATTDRERRAIRSKRVAVR